ncbi:GDSL-type esterase/lipase family protein [uncultured Shewanella sp.]|uniref:GDSL-type esterase/lipase family protein n=1 Tax=uncultured Shewanella sp. TaxID=173975 RepID=UPI002618D569|nr:GDSL-type esterase/lipase family protein [uncultured Shewanella sp.]
MLPYTNTTTFAQNKLNSSRWAKRHHGILNHHQQNNINPDVILMGDSIMQQWEQAGHKVLQPWSKKLIIQNLGFAGDKIQHVLWRVLNGQLDRITPRLLLLNIGTNNVFNNTAQEIAEGVQYLTHQIQRKLPDTQIIVYRLFPRGAKDSIERQITTQASRLYFKLAANSLMEYIDINPIFLDHQGAIPLDIMHDQLHLTPKGYAIWLKQLQPYFKQILKSH